MAFVSLSAAAAAANSASPLALDSIPSASRPTAAAVAALRKRPLLLLDQRPHPSTPTSPLGSIRRPQPPLARRRRRAPVPGRRKRVHSSSFRLRWQTALSVAAKNVALLAVLLYLGDFAWHWVHPTPLPPPDHATLADYNARALLLPPPARLRSRKRW